MILAHAILLTSFEPFGKRDVNLSHEVAARIGKKLGSQVQLCQLPVVYDQAAAKAIDCYEKMDPKPSLVLSLGEGSCVVRLETAATNWDNTPKMADNAGTLRAGAKIVPGGEERIGFNLPMQAMYCAIPATEQKRVVPSITAGNYVCNNTAYRLARYFRGKGVQFGFVHVPHSGCDADVRDPEKNAEVLSALIQQVIEYDAGKAPASAFPHPSNVAVLPAAGMEVERFDRSRATDCERSFLKALQSQYPVK